MVNHGDIKLNLNKLKSFREQALILWTEICKNQDERTTIHGQISKLRKEMYTLSHLIPKQIEEYEKLIYKSVNMEKLELKPLEPLED